MIQQSSVLLFVKVQHEVPFGKALYILGNCQELGYWKLNPENRLNWSSQNNWRRSLVLPKNLQTHYKYAVADFDNPRQEDIEWETGGNRVLDLFRVDQNEAYLIEKWNILRLKIELFTDPTQPILQISIVGNCPDLGMKVTKRKMNEEKENENPQKKLWSISFNFSKYKSYLNYYYYVNIDGTIQKIREPGKFFFIDSENDQNLYNRIDIQYSIGEIIIREKEDFKGFRITRISKNIFIGPYIKKLQDIEVLQQNGVKAILSLQTDQDMSKYGVDWQHIKQQAAQFNIIAQNIQVLDMNFIDFARKSVLALAMLRKLIQTYQCVYVHCTAGIFRSPHLAIIYLVKFQNYPLNDAIELIRDKRPFVYLCVEGMRNMLGGLIVTYQNKKNQTVQFGSNKW